MTNYIGNISTVIKILSITISGWIITASTAHNLNLGIEASVLAEVIGAFIGLGFAYVDAKYPNTFKFLNNESVPIDGTEPILNDEYDTDIEIGDEDDS